MENIQTKWRNLKEGRIQKHRKKVWSQVAPQKNGIPI
jgi:hypothetical protein